jgi:hypothetical protein
MWLHRLHCELSLCICISVMTRSHFMDANEILIQAHVSLAAGAAVWATSAVGDLVWVGHGPAADATDVVTTFTAVTSDRYTACSICR